MAAVWWHWRAWLPVALGHKCFIDGVTENRSSQKNLSAQSWPKTAKPAGPHIKGQMEIDPKGDAIQQQFTCRRQNRGQTYSQTSTEDSCTKVLAKNHKGRNPFTADFHVFQTFGSQDSQLCIKINILFMVILTYPKTDGGTASVSHLKQLLFHFVCI